MVLRPLNLGMQEKFVKFLGECLSTETLEYFTKNYGALVKDTTGGNAYRKNQFFWYKADRVEVPIMDVRFNQCPLMKEFAERFLSAKTAKEAKEAKVVEEPRSYWSISLTKHLGKVVDATGSLLYVPDFIGDVNMVLNRDKEQALKNTFELVISLAPTSRSTES